MVFFGSSAGSSAASRSIGSSITRIPPLLAQSDAALGDLLDIIERYGLISMSTGASSDEAIFMRRIAGGDKRPVVVGYDGLKDVMAAAERTRQQHGRRGRNRFEAVASPGSGSRNFEDEFRCSVCLDVYHVPVFTLCQHVFCLQCIARSLLHLSSCPMCRATVYSKHLKPLSEARTSQLQGVYARYCRLLVQCPSCRLTCHMAEWLNHYNSKECSERLEAIRRGDSVEVQRPSSKAVSSSNNVLSSHEIVRSSNSSAARAEPQAQTVLVRGVPICRRRIRPGSVTSEKSCSSSDHASDTVSTVAPSATSLPSPPLLEELSATLAPETADSNPQVPFLASPPLPPHFVGPIEGPLSTNRLVTFLESPECPEFVVKYFIVTHRMTNSVGALAGLILPESINHAQSVLQLSQRVPSEHDPPDLVRGENTTLFLSMELFGDKPDGIVWKADRVFPALLSTATKITAFSCTSAKAVLIAYLRTVLSERYDLFKWNCLIFCAELKTTFGLEDDGRTTVIPRPTASSPALMRLLNHLMEYGELPTVRTALTPAPAVRPRSNQSRVAKMLASLFSPLRLASHIVSVADNGFGPSRRNLTVVNMVSVVVVPAEDRHRKSLHPLTFAGTFLRNFMGRNEPNNTRIHSNATVLSANEAKLRYFGSPILLLSINCFVPGTFMDRTTIYISLEFRSDEGLWWHQYNEFPPALSSFGAAEDIIASAETRFDLNTLIKGLLVIENKEYDPLLWCAWDFATHLIRWCCPEAESHLLHFPVARSLDLVQWETDALRRWTEHGRRAV